MGNRELSRLSRIAAESNGWIRKSLCNRLDNAIYYYLKAYVYFLMDDIHKGIRELEDGTQKPLKTYLSEQDNRIKTVLDAVSYPDSLQFYITDKRVPFEDFVQTRIWKEGLQSYANSLEKEKKYSDSKKIYHLLTQTDRF